MSGSDFIVFKAGPKALIRIFTFNRIGADLISPDTDGSF